MGIEILAHRELEQEGLEMYVSEGHSSRSCGAKVFNVIRWILWILMILVNYADPIVSLCYGISNYSLKPIITWLSLAAILVSVLYAFTIKIAFSIACLIINIVLRVVVLQLRNGLSEFIFSRIFTILSFCLFGVVFLLEVIEEAIQASSESLDCVLRRTFIETHSFD